MAEPECDHRNGELYTETVFGRQMFIRDGDVYTDPGDDPTDKVRHRFKCYDCGWGSPWFAKASIPEWIARLLDQANGRTF